MLQLYCSEALSEHHTFAAWWQDTTKYTSDDTYKNTRQQFIWPAHRGQSEVVCAPPPLSRTCHGTLSYRQNFTRFWPYVYSAAPSWNNSNLPKSYPYISDNLHSSFLWLEKTQIGLHWDNVWLLCACCSFTTYFHHFHLHNSNKALKIGFPFCCC